MKFTCPYKILHLNKDASIDDKQIKASWRILSDKYHPDTGENGGDNDEFIRVQWAYKFLTNAHKRKDYHKTGRIEEDNTATIMQAARENLIILFKKIIHNDQEFISNFMTVNPFSLMRKEIRKRTQETRGEICEFSTLIQNMNTIKKKVISPKSGENLLLVEVLDQEIVEAMALIEKKRIEIETYRIMLELLEGYSYRTQLLKAI